MPLQHPQQIRRRQQGAPAVLDQCPKAATRLFPLRDVKAPFVVFTRSSQNSQTTCEAAQSWQQKSRRILFLCGFEVRPQGVLSPNTPQKAPYADPWAQSITVAMNVGLTSRITSVSDSPAQRRFRDLCTSKSPGAPSSQSVLDQLPGDAHAACPRSAVRAASTPAVRHSAPCHRCRLQVRNVTLA